MLNENTIDEKSPNKYVGEIEDTIIFRETQDYEISPGNFIHGEVGESVLLPIKYNLVVNDFSKLICALVKGEAGYGRIGYWELGTGDVAWDSLTTPPDPVLTDVTLLTPLYRKAILTTDMSYIDGSNVVSALITNRLQIVVVFLGSEVVGDLRELAIWGGNPTSALSTGRMLNRKTHTKIQKTSSIDLQRTCRFTF